MTSMSIPVGRKKVRDVREYDQFRRNDVPRSRYSRKVKNVFLESDVLKVGHHGSKTSTSENFLKNVSPKIAIIEVGENNYGHPTPEVLAILEQFGIQVLRTDKDGDIKIFSDGKNLKSQKLKIKM